MPPLAKCSLCSSQLPSGSSLPWGSSFFPGTAANPPSPTAEIAACLGGCNHVGGGLFLTYSCLVPCKEATKSVSPRQPLKLHPLFSSRAERTSNQSDWNVTRVTKICKHLQSFMCTLSNEHVIIKWFSHLFSVVGLMKWKQRIILLSWDKKACRKQPALHRTLLTVLSAVRVPSPSTWAL